MGSPFSSTLSNVSPLTATSNGSVVDIATRIHRFVFGENASTPQVNRVSLPGAFSLPRVPVQLNNVESTIAMRHIFGRPAPVRVFTPNVASSSLHNSIPAASLIISRSHTAQVTRQTAPPTELSIPKPVANPVIQINEEDYRDALRLICEKISADPYQGRGCCVILYREISIILKHLERSAWDESIMERLSKDILKSFPDSGFRRVSLKKIKDFPFHR